MKTVPAPVVSLLACAGCTHKAKAAPPRRIGAVPKEK
jgi:hypothetical protein